MWRKLNFFTINVEKYITFSVPVEKEVKRILQNKIEITKVKKHILQVKIYW